MACIADKHIEWPRVV